MGDARIRDPRMKWPAGHDPQSAVVFAHNEVEVRASPEAVWRHLLDCTRWPQWYEHASEVSILQGGPLLELRSQFRFKTLGRYFEPIVLIFEPAEMLAWSAAGPAGTSGTHAWRIERISMGCKVITEEAQRGFLLGLVRSRVRTQLLTMHENWLQSLKVLSEADIY